MKTSFSPSVNIVRDRDRPLKYLPTGNSRQAYEKIAAGFRTGIRSFNIIGSYGTGKSAFLWAVQRQLSKKGTFFGPINGHFNGVKRFEPVNIVGEYDSIVNSFARHIGVTTRHEKKDAILRKLSSIHDRAAKKRAGLLIVVDELGKYLEFAASKDPERELYFIQQLAEFCNDSTKKILLLTSLHQGFDSYARGLDREQRHEWEKVKGRLQDVAFNEQVAQLLFLATEYLRSEGIEKGALSSVGSIVSFTERSQAYDFDGHSIPAIASNLLPLDPLAASVLTLALQECGQNERSLFTFLSSHDPLGIRAFDKRANPLYSLSCVYDYLIGNHFSFIASRDNPRFVQWAGIQRAIERAEGNLDRYPLAASKLVKTIGLLNIFGRDSTRIDSIFLTQYGKVALGIEQPSDIVNELENKKILRFINFKNRYVLFEGTDFDFQAAFQSASSKVDIVTDVVPKLQAFFTFPIVPCKAATLKDGTPRFFEFQISDVPISTLPRGEIDGIINLMFGQQTSTESLKESSKRLDAAIVFCRFQNISAIKDTLFDIEKSKSVLASLTEDLVAQREVKAILDEQIRQLNALVLDGMFEDSVTWIFQGKELKIRSRYDLNRHLSIIARRIYHEAPTFRSELVNRQRLPPAVVTARKNLLSALLSSSDKDELGFAPKSYPAEKTIYHSLLKNTGIHRKRQQGWSLGKPTDLTFDSLWKRCEGFLSSAKSMQRPVADLFEVLLSKPLKLKQGFAEVWVPIFLLIRREDYALFGDQGYIPSLTVDTIDLLLKNPDRFFVKTFDIGGVRLNLLNKYRTFLDRQPAQRISSSSFVDTIRPFLSFYRGLPEYAKTTKRLSAGALSLRTVIATAKDPEKTFFEDFPAALGYTVDGLHKDDKRLHRYIGDLQAGIRELRTVYEGLIDRMEEGLLQHLGYSDVRFPKYRDHLQARFSTLRRHLMLNSQKVFYQRLMSEIDDRRAWLGSIAHAVLGKPLELLTDEEEEMLHAKLTSAIAELDTLCEITSVDVDPQKEEVVRMEITSLSTGTEKHTIRVPKSKTSRVDKLSQDLRNRLSKDKATNIIALMTLLKEQNSNG